LPKRCRILAVRDKWQREQFTLIQKSEMCDRVRVF